LQSFTGKLKTKNPRQMGRVQSRLVALRPHPLSLTTLPEEAGWHGLSPTLNAWLILIRFVATVNKHKKTYR